MKNDIAVAQRLGITATTLEGILTVKGQGMESRGREGGFETPLPISGPRGAQSHLTERIKSAPRRRAQPPHHFTSLPQINGGTKSALVV